MLGHRYLWEAYETVGIDMDDDELNNNKEPSDSRDSVLPNLGNLNNFG